MSFLTPSGFWLLGLLPPLILLYILKVRRQRRRVASTWLWSTAKRDLMAKAPFKRLIAQIPLILQILAVLLLTLALTRPATRGEQLLGDHVAIVIDVSASMSVIEGATDDGPAQTRLGLAKLNAMGLIDALPPGSDAMVLAAAADARMASPLDRDRVRLKAAIEGVQGTDVEGDLSASVALAVDRLRQLGGDGRIVVITDGNLARPESLQGIAIPMDVVTVGTPKENAAIVRVDVRTGTDSSTDKEQVQAFVVVANYGERARELFVTMRQENASDVLASRKVLVKPAERVPVVLTFEPFKGDYGRGLSIELSPNDAMPVDDVAYARVPEGEKLPVVITSEDGKPSAWLQRAIASDPKVELRRSTTAEFLASTAIQPSTMVVIEGSCPKNAPGGDLLLVNPPAGECMGAIVGDEVERPVITSWNTADARLRFLSLDGVNIAVARTLSTKGPSQMLVNAQHGPVVVDISTAARAATLIGFDVGDSDWPLKASFVLFTRNLIEQARVHRAYGMIGPARVGAPLRVSLPLSATGVVVTDPVGTDHPLLTSKADGADPNSPRAATAGLVVLPQVDKTGFYRFAWQGTQAGTMVIPANLTSESESDLTVEMAPPSSAATTVRKAEDDTESFRDWLWMLALIALLVLVLDVWYFTRSPHARASRAAQKAPPAPERKLA